MKRPSLLQLNNVQETVSEGDFRSNSNNSDFLKYYLPQLDDSPNSKPGSDLNNIYAHSNLKDSPPTVDEKQPVSPASGREQRLMHASSDGEQKRQLDHQAFVQGLTNDLLTAN
jgi:hypothetical protein